MALPGEAHKDTRDTPDDGCEAQECHNDAHRKFALQICTHTGIQFFYHNCEDLMDTVLRTTLNHVITVLKQLDNCTNIFQPCIYIYS